MNTSRAAVTVNAILGKLASILGYVVGAFDLLVISIGMSDMDSEGAALGMTFLVVVLGICIFLIFKGIQIKKRIKRFRKYVSLISAENMTSLDSIAGATLQSIDFVKSDLQKMIEKRFFVNAHIDFNTNEIIIGKQDSPVTKPELYLQTSVQSVYETETVTCPGCGATNTKQIGIVNTCEYCGSLV